MKKPIYTCIITAMAILSSCGTITRDAVYQPQDTKLKIALSDLEYLGEEQIEVQYNNYLGFINKTETVNGERYNSADAKYSTIDGRLIGLGQLHKAGYKVLNKYPAATYFQVVRSTKTVDRLFLGSTVTKSAIVRAYRVKDKIDYDEQEYYGDASNAPKRSLQDMLNDRMKAWSQRLQGETLNDYNLRVNDKTRAHQLRIFGQELATEQGLSQIGVPLLRILGYNADKQLLTVGLNGGLPSIYLSMSEDAVKTLDASNLELRNMRYGLRDDESLEIVYAEVYDRTNNKTYTYNNIEGLAPDYNSMQLPLASLTAIQQSAQEEAVLDEIKEEIATEALDKNIISNHTNITVKTAVVPSIENGKNVQNYEVGVAYTVDEEFSVRDDFGPGKYRIEHSNAGTAMMKIVKEALAGEFAKYIVPGKRVKVTVCGTADASPIHGTIPYDACYGNFFNEPVIKDGQQDVITVTRADGITDNYQLAFLRTVGVRRYLEREVHELSKMKPEYTHDIRVSDRKGSEYRKVSVVLTFVDAF